ncbi:MAG: hypothetical protein JXR23_10000 [Pontiellaceae bacterium]|nr:hypothetical protein [Pontiellaceae bacterium]
MMKAVVDGVEEYAQLAQCSGADPVELAAQSETLDRAIQLMRGFHKYGHENMKPAGIPAPKNPYLKPDTPIDAQPPEYYAYEAVQRGGVNRARCLSICEQFGLAPETAEQALDNVIMPWREANHWRTYVRENADGMYVLQDKPPVKLKRHLDRFLQQLVDAQDF